MNHLNHLHGQEFLNHLIMHEKEHPPARQVHREMYHFIQSNFQQGMNYSGNIQIVCERLYTIYPKKYEAGVFVALEQVKEIMMLRFKSQRVFIEDLKPAIWSIFECLAETYPEKLDSFQHPLLNKTKEDFLFYHCLKSQLRIPSLPEQIKQKI